jgi:hypothetical protein
MHEAQSLPGWRQYITGGPQILLPTGAAPAAHHGVQVAEALHLGGRLCELLPEGIAQVVGGVCADDQHAASVCRQLHCQAAGAGGLAHATLAAHPDPLQALLVQNVLQRGLGVVHAAAVLLLVCVCWWEGAV